MASSWYIVVTACLHCKGGVVNGKCETLPEGEIIIFICEPETF